MRIIVYPILGQNVLSKTIRNIEGGQCIAVKTDQLSAGNYVLHVRQGDSYLAGPLVQMSR